MACFFFYFLKSSTQSEKHTHIKARTTQRCALGIFRDFCTVQNKFYIFFIYIGD